MKCDHEALTLRNVSVPDESPRFPPCWRLVAQIALLSCLGSCGGAAPPPLASGRQVPAKAGPQPKLVVMLVIDQFASQTLAALAPLLPEEGFIGGALAGKSLLFERSQYPYANTYTAAGHATIYTSRPPRLHGVAANAYRALEDPGAIVGVYHDNTHTLFGKAQATASPWRLRAQTVADWLKTRDPKAKVVSVSFKDRAAIPGGGRSPDACYWYEPELCGFTTSHYYAKTLAESGVELRGEAFVAPYLATPWTPLKPDALSAAGLSDARPGEARFAGQTNSFPHDPNEGPRPCKALRSTPEGARMLLDVAAQLADTHALGQRDRADFLAVSISTTDYIGHQFGPQSWEYADALMRIDALIAAWLKKLRANREVALVLSADHGVMPLPETRAETAGRLTAQGIVDAANLALRAARLPKVARHFAQPYLYLDEGPVMNDAKVARIRAAAAAGVAALPGVHAVYQAKQLAREPLPEEPVAQAVYWGTEPGTAGDLFVVPADGFVVDSTPPRGTGTSHGSPWSYDTDVPVIVDAKGVAPGRCAKPVSQLQVGNTLAKLLGLPPLTPQGAALSACP